VDIAHPSAREKALALNLDPATCLIHGAYFHHREPEALIGALLDGVGRARVEIDMIRFAGPAFGGVDNRLMSLQLVEQQLTDAAMFTAAGEVVHPRIHPAGSSSAR
jgi:hypothetical protein